MSKQIASYVGTASHLYWLLTGNLHPKLREPITLEDYMFNPIEDLKKCPKSQEKTL
jgi:hypothetical protein